MQFTLCCPSPLSLTASVHTCSHLANHCTLCSVLHIYSSAEVSHCWILFIFMYVSHKWPLVCVAKFPVFSVWINASSATISSINLQETISLILPVTFDDPCFERCLIPKFWEAQPKLCCSVHLAAFSFILACF